MYWRSKLQVFDNSGVIVVKCLQLYRQTKPKIGGLCLVVVRKKRVVRDAVKKKINFFFLTQVKKKIYRRGGSYFCQFFTHGGVLLSGDKDKYLGTRYFTVRVLEMLRFSKSFLFNLPKLSRYCL